MTVDEIEVASGQVRRDDRRTHGVHRPRLAHQRPAPGPDDRPRRQAGDRQSAGARHTTAHAVLGGRRWATSPSATCFSAPTAARPESSPRPTSWSTVRATRCVLGRDLRHCGRSRISGSRPHGPPAVPLANGGRRPSPGHPRVAAGWRRRHERRPRRRCAGLSERGPRRGRARVPDRLQHRGEDDHPSGKGGAPRERNERQFFHSEIVYSKRDVLGALTARTSHSCRVVGGSGPLRRQDDRGDRGERSVRGHGRANHAVAVAQPLRLAPRNLPLDPYLLGAWLGDGHTSDAMITSADPEVLDRIRAAGYDVRRRGDSIRYRIMVPDRSGDAGTASLRVLRQIVRPRDLARPDLRQVVRRPAGERMPAATRLRRVAGVGVRHVRVWLVPLLP